MTDLTRDVTPFTKTRSLRKKSKIRAGGAGKSRGVGRWTEVVRVFELLAEEDGFLEIENYEREVARVDHEGGYVITLRDTEYEREPADARASLTLGTVKKRMITCGRPAVPIIRLIV